MPTSKAITASKLLGKDRYEYYLNELLTEKTVGGHKLSNAQIKEGFSKRKNKISFEKFVDKVITTKTTRATISPNAGPVLSSGSGGVAPKSGAIIKSSSISIQKYSAGGGENSVVENSISIIAKSINSIAEILGKQKKLDDDSTEYERKKSEREKRALSESKLEKRFEGLKKAAEKILAPVKSILDRITEFLVNVFLGRVVYKLLEWFSDPKNASKVNSIIRFFGDHWPKLLALYLTFGTSLGRFVLSLSRTITKGAVKLLAKIAMLAAAKKMRGARGVAKFLGGGKGKLLANVVGTGVALGGAYAVTQGLKGNDEQKTQAYRGGGYVKPKFPTFGGGGLNFKGMMGGASMGAMFGPLGMLLGGSLGSGMMSGFVSGEKGVDKVPAMLSDGEFVMSRGAVAKYGVDTLEAMNAAGGGTNKPKMMSGTTYAQGGGMIGKTPQKTELSKESKSGLVKPATKISTQPSEDSIRQEWNRAFSDMNHPLHQKAAFDDSYNYAQFKKDFLAKNSKPNYKPYKSRFSGSRDAAFAKAKQITGNSPQSSSGFNPFASMNRFNPLMSDIASLAGKGMARALPSMSAKQGYATLKGKYYSSSDQKTYGNYNDAIAARNSRLTSLASQQGLNKLSYEKTPGRRYSLGKRFDTESLARTREDIKRGGFMGQLGRLGSRMFGGAEGRARVDASDKASSARVKQAGATSIGRYYSSSDGKYYKDYNAAVKAKKIRLSQQQKKLGTVKPPVKPKPTYNPAGGGMNGGRSSKGSSVKTKTPNFGATNPSSGNSKAKTLGVRG